MLAAKSARLVAALSLRGLSVFWRKFEQYEREEPHNANDNRIDCDDLRTHGLPLSASEAAKLQIEARRGVGNGEEIVSDFRFPIEAFSEIAASKRALSNHE